MHQNGSDKSNRHVVLTSSPHSLPTPQPLLLPTGLPQAESPWLTHTRSSDFPTFSLPHFCPSVCAKYLMRSHRVSFPNVNTHTNCHTIAQLGTVPRAWHTGKRNSFPAVDLNCSAFVELHTDTAPYCGYFQILICGAACAGSTIYLFSVDGCF